MFVEPGHVIERELGRRLPRPGADNAEGTVIAARPFDRAAVASLISDYPVQAAGATLLALAMRHKDALGVLC
jgi:hypothetical protein